MKFTYLLGLYVGLEGEYDGDVGEYDGDVGLEKKERKKNRHLLSVKITTRKLQLI